MEYFVPSSDMFARQNEAPNFDYVSIEDHAVAAQDPSAQFGN